MSTPKRSIDICGTCYVSHYVDEMREEYTRDFSGLSPTGLVLMLTCRSCDTGRSEHQVQLPPPVREQRNTHSGGVFRLINGGKA